NSTDQGKPFIQVHGNTDTAKIMDEITGRIMQRVESKKEGQGKEKICQR
ncbi:unnamed protein product, partial [marine sediment metagenome]